VDAPSGRGGHTAIWTGNLMVVWGGNNLDTGGRYDPVADTWTPTSLVDAPSGRGGHTADWTGSVMVVWGGYNGSYLDTGGRYDSLTDTWTPTSTVGAPSARDDHTAIWTGSLMAVWGGYNRSILNTGGRYALGHSSDDDGDAFTECGGDCNDDQAAVFPGADELCDGLDNDCNGLVDEGDADGDGYPRCAGDCNDADPGAHAIPAEVAGLLFDADKVTLSWQPMTESGSATAHDVVAGVLAELPVGGGPSERCVAGGIAQGTTTDTAVPAGGTGSWYLVRGRNSCGPGTYGTGSGAVPRVSAACP